MVPYGDLVLLLNADCHLTRALATAAPAETLTPIHSSYATRDRNGHTRMSVSRYEFQRFLNKIQSIHLNACYSPITIAIIITIIVHIKRITILIY